MKISDMKTGSRTEGCYLLQDSYAKTSSTGKPFLSVVLADGSGTIEGKVWDYTGPITPRDIGEILWVKGAVTQFRGVDQLTIEQIRYAEEGEYRPSDLVPSAPISLEESRKELFDLVGSIADEDYRSIVNYLYDRYEEKFLSMPAAKSVHHSFLNGLLMHTLFMARMANELASLYGGFIDRSLLLAGTILHDLAKCDEFETSSLGLVTEYSLKGQLIGHLVLGAQLVAEAAKTLNVPEQKSLLLQHMILSHHGEPQFGAAVMPVCAESELLSCIDRIDSRMEIYREAMEETPLGSFSKRIFALDHKIYHHT